MALNSFIRDFGLNGIPKVNRDTIQGNIVSTFQAGCFFGALLAFPFAERIGRKKTMMIASSVFLLGGTLMTASQGKLNMIYGGRAVAGLGIGASSMVSTICDTFYGQCSFLVGSTCLYFRDSPTLYSWSSRRHLRDRIPRRWYAWFLDQLCC